MEKKVLLEMRHISKAFPGVKALDNISLELRAGEVHALLGENGAGKSTLIKVLGGIYIPEEGEILIDGQPVVIDSVTSAQQNRIRIIHQEIVLEPYMSVAENVFLGRELRTKLGLLDKKAMVRETKKLMDDLNLDIPAEAPLGKLSLGLQQLVEIVKAVSTDARIIVMDEPTSSLSDYETEILFGVIERLKKQDIGIIYISHRISELFQISDRITVMRDGQYIDTVQTSEIESNALVDMMVGRKLEQYYIKTDHKIGNVAIEVEGLSHRKYFKDISFHANYGEIVGFSGLVGAGRSEVMKTIFGIYPSEAGTVKVDGKEVKIANPRQAIDNGIAYISENRKTEGLVIINTVGFNMTLVALNQIIRGIRINKKARDEMIDHYIHSLSIKVTSDKQVVGNLSGGNQQKVVLGKWLANNPKVLILDEPTRGIDVGSKAEIYGIMNDLTEEGVCIIMISSELPEIINMCDRVYVMSEGKMTGMLRSDEFSQNKIMQYAAGGTSYE